MSNKDFATASPRHRKFIGSLCFSKRCRLDTRVAGVSSILFVEGSATDPLHPTSTNLYLLDLLFLYQAMASVGVNAASARNGDREAEYVHHGRVAAAILNSTPSY